MIFPGWVNVRWVGTGTRIEPIELMKAEFSITRKLLTKTDTCGKRIKADGKPETLKHPGFTLKLTTYNSELNRNAD